jgi:prohibitin 2
MAGRFDKIGQMLGSFASKGSPIAVGLGGVAAAAYLGKNTLYNVDAGHIGIKYSRLSGIGAKFFNPGLNFMVPWLERPIIFDIRARPHTMTSLTGSKDLQMVNISLRALARPNPAKLPELYRSIGLDFEEKVLPSIINEVLKSVVAQFNAASLIAERQHVSEMIRAKLETRARDFHILLDDVAITHINFSPEYEKAVEQKQVALQQAEKAKYLVKQAEEVKKRTIIQAEAEQKSAEMIGHAIKTNPGFLELRRINVAKEVATVLSKSSNRMVLSTDALLLNLTDAASLQVTNTLDAGEVKGKKR